VTLPLDGKLGKVNMRAALRFGDSLEAAGVEFRSDEWRLAMMTYLCRPISKRCSCGTALRLFEADGGTCEKCVLATDRQRDHPELAPQDDKMAKIGVPPAYRHCTLASFRGTVPAKLDDWIARPGGCLVLWGPQTGVGKTHLATAALYSLANAGRRCWWFSSSELAKRLSLETFDKDRPTHTKTVRVEYLLIDDLGKEEGVAPKAKELVLDVLHERFRFRRSTLVTTNKSDEALIAYDVAVASRLFAGTEVEVGGEDRRIIPWPETAPGASTL